MTDPAKTDEKRQDDTGFSGPRLWITIALLLALGAFVVYMLAGAGTASETLWNRQVYLFGGFEAIVFTAVGWLFGREVHRASAETAKAEASEAKQEASAALKQAADEQAKGKAMKAAVLALASPSAATATPRPPGAEKHGDVSGPLSTPSTRPGSGGSGDSGGSVDSSGPADTALTRLAENLWPDA